MNAPTDLPATVPALRPEQIGPGAETICCLAIHAYRAFPARPEAALKAMARMIGTKPTANRIGVWNDAHTPEERAEVWRKTMESLGYVRRGEVYELAEGA